MWMKGNVRTNESNLNNRLKLQINIDVITCGESKGY